MMDNLSLNNLKKTSKGTVVMYTLNAFGHIHSMIYIAREMLDRNYRVIILTIGEPKWAHKVREMGLEIVYCYQETSPGSIDSIMDSDPVKALRKMASAMRSHVNQLNLKHDWIEEKLKNLQPDLVLTDLFASMPCVTKLCCPFATLYPASPLGIFSRFNKKCVSWLGLSVDEMTPEMRRMADEYWQSGYNAAREFYQRHGVDIQDNDSTRYMALGLSSPHLNFYLGPREIGYELTGEFKPLPDTWHLLEHTIKLSPANKFETPACLQDLPGKLVYFSLGTLASLETSIINRLLAILSKSPHRYIVSMGIFANKIKLYSNMWGKEYMDQHAVLSVADMFITHCGHNSTIEAFYHGVPSIIALPAFGDQLDIAQRLQECGLGKRLNVFTCTEEELLGAIESQLANEEAKRRMKEIGERLRSIDYPSIGADKLESLISNRTGKSDERERES